jgi:hypothetical protein
MFDWIIEIDEPKQTLTIENGDFEIEYLPKQISLPNMNEVCQLLAAFHVIINNETLTIIPIKNKKTLDLVLTEITPHYSEVRKIIINNKVEEINLKDLKDESKKIFEKLSSDGIYPVIPDLYRDNKISRIRGSQSNIKFFSLVYEKITPLNIEGTVIVEKFFKDSFFAKDNFVSLTPTGWYLTNELKNSVTLRSFCTFATQIVLTVDLYDNSVLRLDIYG